MVTPHHSDQSAASQGKGRPLQFHFNSSSGSLGFFAGFINGSGAGDGDAHAALTFHLRFTEKPQLGVWLGQGFIQVAKTNLFTLALHKNHRTGTRTVLNDVGDGQAKDGAGVQSELGQIL